MKGHSKAKKKLMNINKVDLVAILEPFINMTNIDRYLKYFGLQHYISNTNGQIWLMWTENFHTSVMTNDDQLTNTDLYIIALS